MVRIGSGVALIMAFAFCSSFAQDAKGDRDAIQGKWDVVAAVYDGKPSDLKAEPWAFTESNVIYDNGNQDAYKLDPTTKPKQIEFTISPERAVRLGIYELNGDTLRICMGYSDKDRPKDFKSGPGRNVFTLKRIKTE